MNPLEVAAFKRGMDLLMNMEDGSYVVDDELFSSCAKDIKAKCIL